MTDNFIGGVKTEPHKRTDYRVAISQLKVPYGNAIQCHHTDQTISNLVRAYFVMTFVSFIPHWEILAVLRMIV